MVFNTTFNNISVILWHSVFFFLINGLHMRPEQTDHQSTRIKHQTLNINTIKNETQVYGVTKYFQL